MIFDKLLLSRKVILEQIFDAIENKKSFLLTYLNQHSFNIYSRNNEYKKLLDTKFNVYQADLGVYLFLKFIKKKNIRRIIGTRLNEDVLTQLIVKKIAVYFIGGNFSESFIKNESTKRNINLAGYQSGYFSETETADIIKKVNESSAKIFFIGMGVPKQEFFAYQLSKNSSDKTFICCGNFMEFYFGTVKRSPLIFQKLGVEWLFRLGIEPRRLWKRYLLGIPEFLFRVMKIK